MEEFLSFRKMITPLLIQAIFWIGVVVAVLAGLITMFHSSFIAGLIELVIGPLVVRIYCELLILFFRMLDELSAIRAAITGSAPGGFPVSPMPPSSPAAPGYPGSPVAAPVAPVTPPTY